MLSAKERAIEKEVDFRKERLTAATKEYIDAKAASDMPLVISINMGDEYE